MKQRICAGQIYYWRRCTGKLTYVSANIGDEVKRVPFCDRCLRLIQQPTIYLRGSVVA